jgi:hypothetical protein
MPVGDRWRNGLVLALLVAPLDIAWACSSHIEVRHAESLAQFHGIVLFVPMRCADLNECIAVKKAIADEVRRLNRFQPVDADRARTIAIIRNLDLRNSKTPGILVDAVDAEAALIVDSRGGDGFVPGCQVRVQLVDRRGNNLLDGIGSASTINLLEKEKHMVVKLVRRILKKAFRHSAPPGS